MKPGAELVYWVEYVIRTNGAPHMKSPALLVPWYQKTYLDLVAIILFALIVILVIIKKMFSLLSSKKKIEGGVRKKTN